MPNDNTTPKLNFRSIKRFFLLTLSEPKLLTLSVILALGTSATAALWPFMLGLIIDALRQNSSTATIFTLTIYLALIEAIRLVSSYFQALSFLKLGQSVLLSLRLKLYKHLLELPASKIDYLNSGNITSLLTNDIAALSGLFNAGFVKIVERFLSIGGMLLGMLLLEFWLSLKCLGFLLAFAAFAFFYSKKLFKAYSDIRTQFARFNSFLTERIQGISALHANNAEISETQKSSLVCQDLQNAQFQPIEMFGHLHAVMTITIGSCYAFLIYYGGLMVQGGQLSIGNLFTISSYILWIFWPLITIINEWYVFLSGMAAAERVFQALDWPIEEQQEILPARKINPKGEIEFRNVSFAYQADNWVLKNISFKIQAGQRIAIVGPSGSGKSTILSLILRFYTPQKGQILIDGQALESFKPKDLRSACGLIQQDVLLFTASIKDNVTLWQEKDYELLLDLDPNLQVSAQGANLSMGQRQAIAFSRVLCHRPRIWLIDEATAYLGPALDAKLRETLDKVAKNQTRITIAHKLAGITDSDKIFVLNQGEIVESGSHAELLENRGIYARMFELQLVGGG